MRTGPTLDGIHLVRRLEVLAERRADIASKRAFLVTDEPAPSEQDILDDEARELARTCAPFAGAWAAANAGHHVVALDGAGDPLTEPTRDLPALIEMWREHPDRWAGVPCGELYDRAATLVVGEDARRWLRETAVRPREPGWVKDPALRDDPAPVRDLLSVQQWWVQYNPRRTEPWATIQLPMGSQGDATAQRLVRPPTSSAVVHVWRWPVGRELPAGRLQLPGEIRVLGAVPVDGAHVQVPVNGASVDMVVASFPHAHSAAPDWLAAALSAAEAGPAPPTWRWPHWRGFRASPYDVLDSVL